MALFPAQRDPNRRFSTGLLNIQAIVPLELDAMGSGGR